MQIIYNYYSSFSCDTLLAQVSPRVSRSLYPGVFIIAINREEKPPATRARTRMYRGTVESEGNRTLRNIRADHHASRSVISDSHSIYFSRLLRASPRFLFSPLLILKQSRSCVGSSGKKKARKSHLRHRDSRARESSFGDG